MSWLLLIRLHHACDWLAVEFVLITVFLGPFKKNLLGAKNEPQWTQSQQRLCWSWAPTFIVGLNCTSPPKSSRVVGGEQFKWNRTNNIFCVVTDRDKDRFSQEQHLSQVTSHHLSTETTPQLFFFLSHIRNTAKQRSACPYFLKQAVGMAAVNDTSWLRTLQPRTSLGRTTGYRNVAHCKDWPAECGLESF